MYPGPGRSWASKTSAVTAPEPLGRFESAGFEATGRLETAGRLESAGSEATGRLETAGCLENAGFEVAWRFESAGFEATGRLETAGRLANAGFEATWRFEVSRTLASKRWIQKHLAPCMDIHGSTLVYIYITIYIWPVALIAVT